MSTVCPVAMSYAPYGMLTLLIEAMGWPPTYANDLYKGLKKLVQVQHGPCCYGIGPLMECVYLSTGAKGLSTKFHAALITFSVGLAHVQYWP